MKSPEEIKRALEYCNMLTNRKNICESCPYNGECTGEGKPDQPGWDALLYIQQLEEKLARRDELLAVLGVKVPEEVSHEND